MARCYFTDNEAVYCEAHLGCTAAMTSRDISGQPIEEVTPEYVRGGQAMGVVFACETCGVTPSSLHLRRHPTGH